TWPVCVATSNVKYLPNMRAEYQRNAVPASIRPMPSTNAAGRSVRRLVCGTRSDKAKLATIPTHHRTAISKSEPRSLICEDAPDRRVKEATISGRIQITHAPQNTNEYADPWESGRGRMVTSGCRDARL